MDHLPYPNDSISPPPSVPYLGARFRDLEYDLQGVFGFLERRNMKNLFTQDASPEEFLHSLCVFQSCCFMGLCIEFFRIWEIKVEITDLLKSDQQLDDLMKVVITTQELPKVFSILEAKTRDFGDTDEDAELFSEVDELLRSVGDFVSQLELESIRKTERELALASSSDGLLFDRIHLSVILLGQYLNTGANFVNSLPQNWGLSPWLRERMLEAGWCRSEIFSLWDQHKANPSFVYYLSSFNRNSLNSQVEHQHCGDDMRCHRENLDHSTYRTRHTLDCSSPDCGMLVVDTASHPVISDMVISGKTPLIVIHERNRPEVSVSIESSSLQDEAQLAQRSPPKEYVCISHVWSDGLGNLHENGIPWCQAIRIQRLVNDLFPEYNGPVPFWLDTLCVPLRRPARDKAIESMRFIYANAVKVLVLDNVMAQATVQGCDVTELAMRIRTSTWGRRLWTLHEARLAKIVFYQFYDQAVTYNLLREQAERELIPHSLDSRKQREESVEHADWVVKLRLLSLNKALENSLDWIRDQEQGPVNPEMSHWNIVVLSNCLHYRWTSWLEDETICLAGILGRGISEVIQFADAEDRMYAFLTSFETLPGDILFVHRMRSGRKGRRWLPLSFLGGTNQTSLRPTPDKAVPTKDGLLVFCGGIILRESILLKGAFEIFAISYEGQCYWVRFISGTTSERFANSDLAILLRHELRWTGNPPPGVRDGSVEGVLVTVLDRQRELIVVQYEELVDIEIESEEENLSPSSLLSTMALPESQKWLVR